MADGCKHAPKYKDTNFCPDCAPRKYETFCDTDAMNICIAIDSLRAQQIRIADALEDLADLWRTTALDGYGMTCVNTYDKT